MIKLTEEQARDIIYGPFPAKHYAQKYGIQRNYVTALRRGMYRKNLHPSRLDRFNRNRDLAKAVLHKWRRYSTVSCDQSDLLQAALMAVWNSSEPMKVKRGFVANGVANSVRNAIRDDQRARNPSLGNGERIKSSAFVSTAVHDEALCGPGTATVESCLESAPVGDLDAAIDIMAAVDRLPPKLASVIRRRYLDGTDQDQADLAQTDGVSRAYIGQLEQKAMGRLRKLLA
jgi:RNA polymerase sigma factor (sigma-70 family)